MNNLEESEILLVRALSLGLEKNKLVSLRDVPDLEVEKLDCWEILSKDPWGVHETSSGFELPWKME